jgi:hypothetical protein
MTSTHTETMLVEPSQATAWLAEGYFAVQRRISRAYVDELAGAMRRGQFQAAAVEINFARLDGWRLLINGQHRLRPADARHHP